MIPITIEPSGMLHYSALHWCREYLAAPTKQFGIDLQNSGFTINDLKGKKLILDFRGEGQCDITAKSFVDLLRFHAQANIMAVYNSVVDCAKLDYKAISMPCWLTVHCQWLDKLQHHDNNFQVDAKFICLMRRASHSRAMLASRLLHLDSIVMSFGSESKFGLSTYKKYFPGIELPILIDGIVDRCTNDVEHDQSAQIFNNCLFNIVAESGSQSDPTWQSQLITEKSFKAFGLKQIPIWFALPGLVAKVRSFGFDLFDDLINHDYDHEENEQDRLQKIITQINRVNILTLQQCQDLRHTLAPRLLANLDLVKSISHQQYLIYKKSIKEFYET